MEGMSYSNGYVDQKSEASENPFLRPNSDDETETMSNSEGMDQISELDQSPWRFCYGRSHSDASVFSDLTDETSSFASDSASPLRWLGNGNLSPHFISKLMSKCTFKKEDTDGQNLERASMKERFAHLMLGGDMSGAGKGDSRVKSISDAIIKLSSTIFDDYKKLEYLDSDKKAKWMREINFLLAPCNYIVESGGTEQANFVTRSDISSTLPALKRLDSQILEIMESFVGIDKEIQYAEAADERRHPIPLLPSGGLSEKTRRLLKQQHRNATQFHRAASALNRIIIADMETPEFLLESLPKNGKEVLGDAMYRYLTYSAKFRQSELIGYLNLTSEHEAKETVAKLEDAMVIWSSKALTKALEKDNQLKRSSWKMVKDLVTDADKNANLARRALDVISSLKDKFRLAHTSLDTIKLEHNTDIGKAIMEAYSRLLERLAFQIFSKIDDVSASDKNMRTLLAQLRM